MKQDFKEIVLSARQDDFFRKNMTSNFGDIGTAVQSLVTEFQRQKDSTSKMQSLQVSFC